MKSKPTVRNRVENNQRFHKRFFHSFITSIEFGYQTLRHTWNCFFQSMWKFTEVCLILISKYILHRGYILLCIFIFFLLRNTFCNAKFRGFFFITNRKLQFFCGSLKHGSVLSMLDNNTKTRTALTLPTDHTNSLAMGLLPTKETQGCRFLRSFFKNQTGHITKENSQKNGQFKGRFYTFIFSVVGFS